MNQTKTPRQTADHRAGRRSLAARLMRRTAALAALLMLPVVAHGADNRFPDRPLSLIVPATTGGSSDIVARLLADRLSRVLGQNVIVVNRAGAGGIVASTSTLEKPADGYTLMLSISSKTVLKSLQGSLSFDPIKDFRTVALVSRVPTVLVASSKFQARDFAGLKTYATANPGKLTWAIPGIGTAPHLSARLLTRAMPARVNEVQYRGSAPLHIDLIAGVVDVAIDSYTALKPHLDSGALTPIATIGHARIEQLPNTPTLSELGYDDFKTLLLDGWNAIDVRSETPPEISDRLAAAVREALADPDLQARVRQTGLVPLDVRSGESPQAFVERTTGSVSPLARELAAEPR